MRRRSNVPGTDLPVRAARRQAAKPLVAAVLPDVPVHFAPVTPPPSAPASRPGRGQGTSQAHRPRPEGGDTVNPYVGLAIPGLAWYP